MLSFLDAYRFSLPAIQAFSPAFPSAVHHGQAISAPCRMYPVPKQCVQLGLALRRGTLVPPDPSMFFSTRIVSGSSLAAGAGVVGTVIFTSG